MKCSLVNYIGSCVHYTDVPNRYLNMLETPPMDKREHLWPYVLFLPESSERRLDFIRTVLASKIAPSVLSSFDQGGKVLQRDLVKQLPHSNKSILAYLRTLKEFALVKTGSEVEGGKRVVYHELSRSGWSLARFFSEGLPSDLGELTEYLLEDYLTNLVSLYRDLGLDESLIFEVFTRARAKGILQGSTSYDRPEFVLFGASAFFTEVECRKLPPPGGEVGCKVPERYSGGPTIRLALALADQKHKVAFVSAVGNDQDGWNVITSLVSQKVDVSHFVVEDDKQTNKTILIGDEKGKRTLVGIGDLSALSITSPSQVPWETLAEARVVYLGEVFVEVAVSIAAYARARNIPIVYRCSPHYWRRGIDELEPILKQVDILVASSREWKEAKGVLGPKPLSKLAESTNAAIVLKHSQDAYKIYKNANSRPTELVSESYTDDITGWLMAGIVQAIGHREDTVKAVDRGIVLENSMLAGG